MDGKIKKKGEKNKGFIAQDLKKVQDEAGVDSLNSYQLYPAEYDEDGNPYEDEIGIDVLKEDYGKL